MHNVTHILLWRHCDSKSFTVVLVGGQRPISEVCHIHGFIVILFFR